MKNLVWVEHDNASVKDATQGAVSTSRLSTMASQARSNSETYAALDLYRTFVDPVGNELGVILCLSAGSVEHSLPRIIVACLAPSHHIDLDL